jgi:hypothetical protein
MARWNLLMAAATVAAGTIGCAHCDTCDDFPVPCVGANCNGPTMAYGGPAMGGPAMSGPATGGTVNAPANGELGAELGPYGSEGGATVGPGGNAAPVPANPNPPGDPGLLPPSDSPPPRPAEPGNPGL